EPTTDMRQPEGFTINSELYRTDTTVPENTLELSKPMIWRDVRFVNTSIYPVTVNPASRTVTAAGRIIYELIYTDGDAVNPKLHRNRGVSPALEPMYRSALLNYDALNLPLDRSRDTSVTYLIIADDSLMSSIMPLADWHTRTGIYTEVVAASTVGTTPAEFKAFIQTYYDNEGTEYVLLVGETTTVPLGNTGSLNPGDYSYQLLEGGDDIADLACGRIITTDPNIVDHVVARTLNYIQSPPMDGWLDKSMLCAHEEQYPGKYTECKEAIRTYAYGLHTMIFDTYYPPEGATHAMVVAAMEEGRGVVNYRGHGDNTYWTWSPDWDVDHVYALNNGAHTPIVWNIACYNGNITIGGECLSEAWQNAGSSGEGGAVANIGATEPSYTIANHAFDKMLYRAPLDESIFRWGYVVDRSKEYMIAEEGQYGIDNSYMYICFGDPAIDMHMMEPMTLNVDHLPTAPIGGGDYTVTVSDGRAPIAGAMVCIMKADDDLYEVGLTDATGTVALPATLTSGGFMQLTVTAHNALPYTADIIVEAAGCGAILLNHSFYNCSQEVLIRVWDSDLNLNPGVAETTSIDISSDSEPTVEIVVLMETGPDTAEFAGTIMTSDTQSGPGYLLLAHDDLITAVYHDADCEGAPRDVDDTATADCQGPTITNVTVDLVTTDSATITWTTDEASDTRVMYGTGLPPSVEYYDDGMDTEHVVVLEGLDDCTEYHFYVESTDSGGNVAVDDNGGMYYEFTTYELQVFFSDDIESGEGDWTYDGLWHIVPEASACNENHSPTHSWYYGQESTCTFNTGSANSGTLTSPIIDLTGATEAELHCWYWFEGESSTTY
ncbi:MAG TPA: C25 family cysteine peptidase, partial [bacterium]|nr:C25 family cysteine peptidase [bacterium]